MNFDIVGKPFHPNVRAEFKRRKRLSQSYEESFELYNLPFFNIRRIEALDGVNQFQSSELPESSQFTSMGLINQQSDVLRGADHQIEKLEKRPPIGITSVEMVQEDFTFTTTTVNFKINNIEDFEQFKKIWLIWGAPVEFEFGRQSPSELVESTIYPNYEKKQGFVANFSYRRGGENRTLEGSLTIYDSNWLIMMDATNTGVDNSNLLENLSVEILEHAYYLYSLKFRGSGIENNSYDLYFDEYENIFQSKFETIIINYTPHELAVGIGRSDIRGNFGEERILREKKSKYFYSILDTSQVSNDLKNVSKKTENWNKAPNNSNFITNVTALERAWKSLFDSRYRVPLGQQPRDPVYRIDYLFGAEIFDLNSIIQNTNNILDNLTLLQKYSLSNISSGDYLKEAIGTKYHYYVSLRTIEFMFFQYMKDTKRINSEESISTIDCTTEIIPNFKKVGLGVGSIFPERVIFNPWETSYNFTDKNGVSQDDVCLLADVFISADIVYGHARTQKNFYNFISKIIEEVNLASGGTINLQKIENIESVDGYQKSLGIIFKDFNHLIDFSGNPENDDEEYTVFDLSDPSERIIDSSVETDIQSDMASMVFFQNRKIVDSSNLIYYNGELYTKDGELYQDSETPDAEIPYRTYRVNQPDLIYLAEADQEETNQSNKLSNLKKQSEDYLTKISKRLTNAQKDILIRVRNNQLDNNSANVNPEIQSLILAFTRMFYGLKLEAYELSLLLDSYRDTREIKTSTQMPLRQDLTFDGISGILMTQCFKTDFRSFPMLYGNNEINPLFSVSNLSHFIIGNRWTTKIGGTWFGTSQFNRDVISGDVELESVMKSKSLSLQRTIDTLKENFNALFEQ